MNNKKLDEIYSPYCSSRHIDKMDKINKNKGEQ